MKSLPHKGQLTTWKDDRGFGFIKPDDGSKEVFLHISVLKGAGRRPIVGDTIFYEKTIEANGKIRASKASIQDVINQPTVLTKRSRNSNQDFNKESTVKRIDGNTPINKRDMRKLARKLIPIVFLIGLGMSLISVAINSVRGCNIKGNISASTGIKLYHLPNMEDYATTNIDASKGEKWFCSESEAIANGWSKAPR
ncbi:MAG: DNA-binding protein [Pseudanabaena frigida]|uniref:DNA-binding protein n=1 Tax=Pseudanabaena frigida TaxID=945775 RepID=A0A2W4YFS7_9CYAN|nr:MAG: DNA-binding protein [Pseudanabaena frigida]